jgi:hypothetical protein
MGARLAMAGFGSSHGRELAVRGGSIQTNVSPGLPHEVGLTDVVSGILSSLGPTGTFVSVSSTAEARHVGADVALVDEGFRRVLLFQAKVAAESNINRIVFKSRVAHQHIRLLQQRTITADGNRYEVASRLAVYQSDVAACAGDSHLHPSRSSIDHRLWWRLQDLP